MSLNCGIYQIRCTANNKRYIGSSVNVERRWYKHIYELRRNLHHNYLLQDDYVKFGEESFGFSIIEICNKNSFIQKEHDYVEQYNSLDKNFGYNLIDPLKGRDFSKPVRYLSDRDIEVAKILLSIGLSIWRVSKICHIGCQAVKNICSLKIFENSFCCYNKYLTGENTRPNLVDLINRLIKIDFDLDYLLNEKTWRLISPIPSKLFCNYYSLDYAPTEYGKKNVYTDRDASNINNIQPKQKKNTGAIKKKRQKCLQLPHNIINPYRDKSGNWNEKFINRK